MTRVAVLGTGTMGAPMARRLAESGHDVVAWNRTRSKAEGLGASVTDTPAEAVADADVVITMLADAAAVDGVMREALPAAKAGAFWAQSSTVGTSGGRRLAERGAEHGVVCVDAPVLGSRIPAEQGQLVVLAAGPSEARARCEEVFAAFSRKVLWVGEAPPAGQALKLVVNGWILKSVANIGETVALAEALGADPRQWLEAISGGAMDMQYAHMKADLILSGELQPAFRLSLAHKDTGLVLEAAEEAGVELGLARATLEEMARAIELGHADEDMAAVYYAVKPN
jgi:3-hydroxyisobutyrate dehydrogenase